MRQHPLLAFATAVSTIPLTLFGALGNAGAASTNHLSDHADRATLSATLHRARSHKRSRPKHARRRANTAVHPRSAVLSADVLVKGEVTRHVFVPLGGVWSALRNCESSGDYATDTGNGYYGAYQFDLTTWRGLQLSGLPSSASPAIQDAAAVRFEKVEGWRPWPNCSWALGLAS
jgi:hypothetical protein